MKLLVISAAALLLTACVTPGGGTDKSSSSSGGLGSVSMGGSGATSSDNKVGAALDVFKAATVSDDELKSTSLQLRAYEAKRVKVAPAGDKYQKRLDRLTRKHQKEDGLNLNFKVYLTKDINANATADGSIRFYAGIMDMMTDAEMLGIIGHEIGHVKHGHSMSEMRTAYLASAGRKAAASSGGVAGALADSELGALSEKLVNSQYSQSQETESDDYGLAFMKKHGYPVKGMETAFRKLAKLSGKSGGMEQMLASHPDSAARADRMRDKAAAK